MQLKVFLTLKVSTKRAKLKLKRLFPTVQLPKITRELIKIENLHLRPKKMNKQRTKLVQ